MRAFTGPARSQCGGQKVGDAWWMVDGLDQAQVLLPGLSYSSHVLVLLLRALQPANRRRESKSQVSLVPCVCTIEGKEPSGGPSQWRGRNWGSWKSYRKAEGNIDFCISPPTGSQTNAFSRIIYALNHNSHPQGPRLVCLVTSFMPCTDHLPWGPRSSLSRHPHSSMSFSYVGEVLCLPMKPPTRSRGVLSMRSHQDSQ